MTDPPHYHYEEKEPVEGCSCWNCTVRRMAARVDATPIEPYFRKYDPFTGELIEESP